MSAEIAHELQQQTIEEPRAVAQSLRARLLLGLGWLVVAAGVAWALVQPYRLTILHPHGQGFWWLVSEPPLYVVLAGIVFRLVVAKPLVKDLGLAGLRGHGGTSSDHAGRRDTASSVAPIDELSALPASLSRTRPSRPVDGATPAEAGR
jgi:hypothetical protein